MAHERVFSDVGDSGQTYWVNVLELGAITISDNQNGTFTLALLGIFGKTFNSQQDAQDEADIWIARIEAAR